MNESILPLAIVGACVASLVWLGPWTVTRLAARNRAMGLYERLGNPLLDKDLRRAEVQKELELGFIPFPLLEKVAAARAIKITAPVNTASLEVEAFDLSVLSGPRQTIGTPRPALTGSSRESGQGHESGSGAHTPPPLNLEITEQEDLWA